MASDTPAPQGQAALNSHTIWGSILTAFSAFGGTEALAPVVVAVLNTMGLPVTVPEVDALLKAFGVVGGTGWTWYGRVKATAPITGILKAK